jgi:hypothetical protein
MTGLRTTDYRRPGRQDRTWRNEIYNIDVKTVKFLITDKAANMTKLAKNS